MITQHIISLIAMERIVELLGLGKLSDLHKSVINFKIHSLPGANAFILKMKDAQILPLPELKV